MNLKKVIKNSSRNFKIRKPVWLKLDEFKTERKKFYLRVQGILLDVDHGTYPATSSNTVPATAATGSGTGPDKIGYVLVLQKLIPQE